MKTIICLICVCFLSLSAYAQEKKQFKYDAQGKRDPFAYSVAADDSSIMRDISLLNFEVNGIIWDENDAYAIINDQIVKKGDTLKGAQIIAVNKYSVVFGINNKEYEVNVKKEDNQ